MKYDFGNGQKTFIVRMGGWTVVIFGIQFSLIEIILTMML